MSVCLSNVNAATAVKDVFVVVCLSSLRSETVNALRPCTEAPVRDDYSEDDITLDPLIVLRCDTRVFRSVTCNSPAYISVALYSMV